MVKVNRMHKSNDFSDELSLVTPKPKFKSKFKKGQSLSEKNLSKKIKSIMTLPESLAATQIRRKNFLKPDMKPPKKLGKFLSNAVLKPDKANSTESCSRSFKPLKADKIEKTSKKEKRINVSKPIVESMSKVTKLLQPDTKGLGVAEKTIIKRKKKEKKLKNVNTLEADLHTHSSNSDTAGGDAHNTDSTRLLTERRTERKFKACLSLKRKEKEFIDCNAAKSSKKEEVNSESTHIKVKPSKRKKLEKIGQSNKLKLGITTKASKLKQKKSGYNSIDSTNSGKDINLKEKKRKKKSIKVQNNESNKRSIPSRTTNNKFDDVPNGSSGPSEELDGQAATKDESDGFKVNKGAADVSRKKKKFTTDGRIELKAGADCDMAREKNLRMIATQGMVQLFSTINQYQVKTRQKLAEAETEAQRENVLDSGRELFMELFDKERNRPEGGLCKTEDTEIKSEVKTEDEPSGRRKHTWNVFSDNFYKDAAKGWDQEESD